MSKIVALCVLCALICSSQAAFSLSKKYYVGGRFTSATFGTTTRQASNIVSWSGTTWEPLSDGFNGIVNDIYLDSAFNVYAVGSFSASGSTNTGPIAVYTNNRWSSIVDGATWSTNATINSISVDCFNLPTSLSLALACDIYVGGSFNLTFGGVTMRNIARYTASSKKWEALTASSDIVLPLTSPVKVLYKKEGGVSLFSSSLYYLWVGGDFGLYMYNTNTKVWKIYSSTMRVNWLYYKRNIISTDVVYVCGQFSFGCSNSKTCTNVATLNHETGAFSAVGAVALNAPVDVCQLGDNNYLYVIGNGLTTTTETRFLAKVKVDNAATSNWIPGIAISSGITSALRDFDVCADKDATCTAGSVAFVGNGIMGFYNAQDNTYQTFGNGTNGDNNCIRGTFKFSTAARMNISSYIPFIVLLLLAFLY